LKSTTGMRLETKHLIKIITNDDNTNNVNNNKNLELGWGREVKG